MLTLNRAAVMNALSAEMRRDLLAALHRALMRARFDKDLAGQLALEAWLQGECGASGDFRAGVAAFLAKCPARFTGRQARFFCEKSDWGDFSAKNQVDDAAGWGCPAAVIGVDT